jgi:hypothetical protein
LGCFWIFPIYLRIELIVNHYIFNHKNSHPVNP